MRYPAPADAEPLLGKNAEWFRQWLYTGLTEYLLERKGRSAFPEIRNFVDQGEGSIVSDLQRMFDVLPVREQENFKEGIALLMQSLDFSRLAHETVAMVSLDIGTAVGAHGLLKIIAAKSFSMSGAHGSKLYSLAFELSAQLADLDPENAVRSLKHLIGHGKLFSPQLSGRALLALCQADPDRFVEHFLSLKDHLEAKYGYGDILEEPRRSRARKRLLKGLDRLVPNKRLFVGILEDRERSFTWWLDTIAAEMPEILQEEMADISEDPELAESSSQAGYRFFPTISPADVFEEVRTALVNAWRLEGRMSSLQAHSDNSGLFFAQTAAMELTVAVEDLGDTSSTRPCETGVVYDLYDEEVI